MFYTYGAKATELALIYCVATCSQFKYIPYSQADCFGFGAGTLAGVLTLIVCSCIDTATFYYNW